MVTVITQRLVEKRGNVIIYRNIQTNQYNVDAVWVITTNQYNVDAVWVITTT